MTRRLNNNSGLTIIEVLIASVVFMVGFSLLIALLNNSLLKYSAKDIDDATLIAQQLMTKSLITADTTGIDSTIEVSGLSYSLNRTVTVSDGLAQVSIEVKRMKTDKTLIVLYNEFRMPKEQ